MAYIHHLIGDFVAAPLDFTGYVLPVKSMNIFRNKLAGLFGCLALLLRDIFGANNPLVVPGGQRNRVFDRAAAAVQALIDHGDGLVGCIFHVHIVLVRTVTGAKRQKEQYWGSFQ